MTSKRQVCVATHILRTRDPTLQAPEVVHVFIRVSVLTTRHSPLRRRRDPGVCWSFHKGVKVASVHADRR